MELRGNVRVYCRLRPTTPTEECPWGILSDQRTVTATAKGQQHAFTFNHIFGSQDSQAQVFAEIAELVQSSLDGYSVCIFSYGQTGAGKTHTMTGKASEEDQGLIPRALAKILDCQQRLKWQDWTYSLELSVMEVYNDRIRDLLGSRSTEVSDINDVKHEEGGHTTVVGVSRTTITSSEQALSLISKASINRSCHSTAMNASSSRSHSILMLNITGRHSDGTTLKGALSMVDLAGSERLTRSKAEGERKAETCAINQSLSSMQSVFEALAAASKPGGSANRHVPYRDSKLTYLLKPALSRGGKALMFVHVSPEEASMSESLHSLRFATKVSGVEVGPARKNGFTPSVTELHQGYSKTYALRSLENNLQKYSGQQLPAMREKEKSTHHRLQTNSFESLIPERHVTADEKHDLTVSYQGSGPYASHLDREEHFREHPTSSKALQLADENSVESASAIVDSGKPVMDFNLRSNSLRKRRQDGALIGERRQKRTSKWH
ncbi:hypothetical protein CEUSTIGMA_g13542.t1 [Chlamydomonas eustigma]|uniref:Kinesin motor domain-containing protein n=1 Tax=Chlamydomonas eustigma TaxID=1157962 RepID=A0A250XT39_9CHLO|nr:hypothetical protein CEUSTIGMA_g13542.t1 [Chlamydomonas eustigma]|eukprot:GAX86129.1 hypothetical protein CEUSTIGMA_g13542.t1 [Chlamydomonas eustigma]